MVGFGGGGRQFQEFQTYCIQEDLAIIHGFERHGCLSVLHIHEKKYSREKKNDGQTSVTQ